MSSSLTVQLTANKGEARLFRGSTQIGAFRLDSHLQIQGVTITRSASEADAEQILRLAGSHVAQYVRTPRTFRDVHAGVLVGTQMIPALPGLSADDSLRLLDFNNIARQHASLTVAQIREMLTGLDIRVDRQR